jgi:hypothetical protein
MDFNSNFPNRRWNLGIQLNDNYSGGEYICYDENNKEIIGDANKETIYNIWHGEEMKKVREMHNEKNGFLKSEVCRSCYLPRETYEEEAKVNNRKIIVHNYCGVDQKIGESKF